MSSNDVAIRVQNLSKRYEIYAAPRDRLKQFVVPPLQLIAGRPPQQYFHEFWALKDISFEVKKGESVGIVGRNGSGKSTLLQIITGTLTPTAGNISTSGRIAALLELGSGFNPEFTGRENVYFQGALMGLSQVEMAHRFSDISAFADIGEFIEQPVRTYSSGMYVRLAFSVAVHVDADILVIDEALAVGDLAFQIKCMNHMQTLIASGKTLLLVSHNLYHVRRLCQKCIYLESGLVKMDGDASVVADAYESEQLQNISIAEEPNSQHSAFKFCSVEIDCAGFQNKTKWRIIGIAIPFAVNITYQLDVSQKSGLQIGVVVKTGNGSTVFGMTTKFAGLRAPNSAGVHVVRVTFDPNILLPGIYGLSVSAFDDAYKEQLGFWDPATYFEIASSDSFNKLHVIGNVTLPNHLEFLSK